MMDFNQLADLGRGFGAIKAHHEKLPHGSICKESVRARFAQRTSPTKKSLQKRGALPVHVIPHRWRFHAG